MIDLKHIELLRVLAEERHFGRTAARLFVSQASVSQQLQRLEHEVGARLVSRTSRSVGLTPAGEVYLAETARISERLDRAAQRAREASAQPALRIGSNYPASRVLLLPLLERLRAREPAVATTLAELSTGEQVSALRLDDLDLGLLFGPLDTDDLATERLIEVPVVAVVRPGHPLERLESVALRDLVRFRCLTGFQDGPRAIEDELVRVAAAVGVRLKRSSDQLPQSQYLFALESSDAVGFATAVRGVQLRATGLRTIRISPPEPTMRVHMAWSRTNGQQAMNVARDELRTLAAGVRGAA